MIINITYDASVANAPAGYKQAIQAAVQYFESTISNNITVNINFGWGEVGGEAISTGAVAESITSLVFTTASTVSAQLRNYGSDEPGAIAAYTSMSASTQAELQTLVSAPISANGTSGGNFTITLAQARALGYTNQYNISPNVVDGYIGLDSGSTYTFDPNDRGVAGAFDAIGVLEHEISQVLGRTAGGGQTLADGTPIYTLLDLYRYSAVGDPSLTAADASFSFDGGRSLVLPFNNPDDGGAGGDNGANTANDTASDDAFGAFAVPGVPLTITPADLVVMEAIGYSLTSPIDVIGSSDIITGVSANGTVTTTNGVETVEAKTVAADAIGVYDANVNFDNTGSMIVKSDMADAWGAFGTNQTFSFINAAGATLTVTAAHQAMGAVFDNDGGSFTNSGTLSITGSTAYGEIGASSFNNTGTITVVATASGAKSVAVDISYPWAITYFNSGTITANYAFLVDEKSTIITVPGGQTPSMLYTTVINNSGRINGIIQLTDVIGQLHNTGLITGPIYFGNFNSIYDGAAGTDTGGIYLGSATNTATLGADGEAVFGGGYADTITGGAGNDFIEIARGSNSIDGGGGFNILSFADADLGVTVDLGVGTATAGGADTIKNIQEVIGTNYNDTLKAGTTAAELVGGAGNDTLIGGAGNDTLVAGTGGATMTGGGGNNTFVVSAGDHRVIITDFGANGDQDVLAIYGYGAALSVQQQGANTLVTLSATDSVLLKNVQASALTSASLVYKTGTFTTAPAEPAAPSVFGTAPIDFTHDLTIAAGEVLNEVNNPYGLYVNTLQVGSSHFHSFDNQGTVNVSTNTGSVTGLLTDNSGYAYNGESFTNAAGELFSVTDTSATGIAYGFQTGFTPIIVNAGTLTVSAKGIAYGAWLGNSNDNTFTNAATGVIRATSSAAAAYGVYFDAGSLATNNGQIIATGVGTAVGVTLLQTEFSTFANNGSIVATATGAGAVSYGIDLQLFPSDPLTIRNTGTISADIAIAMRNAAWVGPLSLINSGTINGLIDIQTDLFDGTAVESITNSGAINGAIHFNDSNDTYSGAGGTQTGGIYLGGGTNMVTLGNDGEQVFGGGDDDTITGGSGNDFIEIGRGQGTIDGGGGVNTLSLADADTGATVNLGTGTVSFAGTYTIKNIQVVIGSSYNDTLVAGTTAATLIAGSGTDTLIGGAGNDTLVAGAGGDTATGGGGNNSFVYSKGDKQFVITDFDARGDQDALTIDGYSVAQSVTQQGADTLITLSATDSVLLKNVTVAQLAGSLTYAATAYQPPAEPASPTVFLSSQLPMEVFNDLAIYAGETLAITATNGDLNFNQNIGLWLPIQNALANNGTITIASADDALQALAISGMFYNATGGRISVTDTGGAATGANVGSANFTAINAGTLTVNALTTARGFQIGYGTLDNAATGAISVVSRTGDALGVDLEQYVTSFTNEGSISAIGAGVVAGIFWNTSITAPVVNSGTITATTTDAGGTAYGIAIYGAYNEQLPYTIVNKGTITATVAIGNMTQADQQGFTPLVIQNYNTLNGALDLGGSDSTVTNSGTINGAINWSRIDPAFTSIGIGSTGVSPPALTNSGTIKGNITLDANTGTITNTGRIIGNITMGDLVTAQVSPGPYVYQGAGGSVTGMITFGLSTNDMISGAGLTVDASANDTLAVTGTGNAVDVIGAGDTMTLSSTGGTWDSVTGLASTISFSGAQSAVTGGGNTLSFVAGTTGNTVGLYATAGTWDSISGSGGIVYFTSAQAAVIGGNNVVSFAGGTGNVTGLYDTGGNWDSVWAPGGETIYLTSAQAAITGGGDTISFAGGNGNVAGLYDTGGNWDSIWAPGGETIYLTSAQAAITGGGDTISFAGGTGNVVGLYDTGGTWDSVWAPGGETIYLTSAQAAITGGGDAISFAGGTGDTVGLYNTGGVADTIWAPGGGTIYFTSAQAIVTGGGDAISFAGGTGNAATLQNTGGVADSVYATNGTISLSNAQAVITGTGDTVNFGGTSTATFTGANQTLAFAAGIGGHDVITGFAASDSVQFAASDFNSWAALLGATTQSGSDTLITLNASDTVRLTGVTASTLTASQFHFV